MNKKHTLFFFASFLILSSFSYQSQLIQDTILSTKPNLDLPEVVIKRNRMPVKMHGDTLSLDAGHYMDANTSKLQDLLKKMPGFRVDQAGRIFFNGKEISKILIDGDDLSGYRYATLSRNLRASLVKQLQVLQRFQENRLMKEHIVSDAIALNINIHEEYKNKPTGNAYASNNVGSYGAINGDLLKLRHNVKQLFFLDKNNIGDEGLNDDKNIQFDETTNIDRNYTSWPFTDLPSGPAFISSRYKNINNDAGVMSLTSNKIGRFIKLRSETKFDKQSLFHFSDTRQHISIPGIDPINTFSLLSTRTNSSAGTFRLVLDIDNKRQHVSRYVFSSSSEFITGSLYEKRKLLEDMQRSFQQRHRNSGFSVHQQETWTIGKRGLLQMENTYAINHHRQLLMIDDSFFFLFPYKKYATKYDQQLFHRGSLFNTHVGRIVGNAGVTVRYGVRGSFQTIYSILDQNEQRYTQQKTYAYFSIVKRLLLKASQEVQFAVGNANHSALSGSINDHLIYRVEHSMTWQIKQLSKIRVGSTIDRTAPDLKLFHAGPLFLHSGIFMMPPISAAYPVSAEIRMDLTKMDLYKGLTVLLSIRSGTTRHGQGTSSFITPSFSSAGYFIMSEQKNVSVASNIEQFIFPLKMKYVFNGSWMFMKLPQQLNNEIFQTAIYTLGIEHKMISNWKGRLNIELNYRSDRSRFVSVSSNGPGSQFSRHHYSVHGNLRISKTFSGVVHHSGIYTGGGNYFSMADARIKAILSSRFTASLELSNIMNNQCYREISAGLYTSQSYAMQLNGRRILFGVNYSF